MSRYIDADKLCKGLTEMAKYQEPYKQSTILGVVSTIQNTRTADVVEVVRCRDCKHLLVDEDGYTYCSDSCGLDGVDLSDYCSDGERSADDGT